MRGPYHHSSVAGSAVSASDISSASRPAGLHAAAVPNSASSGKFRAAPSPKGVGSRHVVPDLQGAQHGWAAPGMGGGQPQPWDGAGSLASLPLELPPHFGDTSMAPTGPVHAALRSHPADIFMLEQEQGIVGGGSNGRRARGHYRSSSDGGGGGGLGVVNSGGNSGRNDYHRCGGIAVTHCVSVARAACTKLAVASLSSGTQTRCAAAATCRDTLTTTTAPKQSRMLRQQSACCRLSPHLQPKPNL